MKAITKISLVICGYVVAFAIAFTAMEIYTAMTSGPDRQTYGAMYSFGDSVLFLAIFAVAAVPGTALGLYFLRSYPAFWKVLSAIALCVAGTGVLAIIAWFGGRLAGINSSLHMLAGFAVLRMFAAP